MPIFRLVDEVIFPPIDLTSGNGILAVGGDLLPQRLIAAYSEGIFPWYSEGEPIIWWSPDPRFILFLNELRVSRSMMKVLRRGTFRITYDQKFREVVLSCQGLRRKQKGTWITDDMLEAYCKLHELGIAHSAEAWHEGQLVGGIYGVSLGRCFFGESMFSIMSNASKAALINLVHKLEELKFAFLDCQVYTAHMESLGARFISRGKFMGLLKSGLEHETMQGNWGVMPEFRDGKAVS
jgi:leucyl/phenylalanyl-tRNA--protein transferase